MIAVLYAAGPEHASVGLTNGVQRPAGSSAADKNNAVDRGWRRRERILAWKLNAPEMASSRCIKRLHHSIIVYDKDFAGIIGGSGGPVGARDIHRPDLLACVFVKSDQRRARVRPARNDNQSLGDQGIRH